MITVRAILWLLFSTYLTCACSSHDSIVSVINRLDQFDRKLLDNKMYVLDIIDGAKTSLRTELKENIRDQVREAMAEILQGESLQDMVKSQVVSELRHLTRGYHQMKRQLHHVSKSLKDFQEETTVFHDSILEKADVLIRDNSSDICVRDKHRLEIDLRKCDAYAADLKTDIERWMVLNETCQSQISQLKTALVVSASSQATKHVTSTSRSHVLTTSVTTPRPPVSTTSVTTPRPPVSTTSVTTPRPPVSTTSVTTPRPEEEKSRILIVPFESSTKHQFRQLNIHSNSLSVYQHHTMKKMTSVAYIEKTRTLLLGSYGPYRILASTLDTSHVTVLREGVRALGMAVDEDRDIVFIATYEPQFTISRVSTLGKDFTTIIDLSKYGGAPRQLTLDTRRKRIYGCNGGKLFTVTYDGQGLATLATGRYMYAVTLDETAGVLYYNNEKKLMKMTVSNNVSTEMTELNVVPYNMILYRGTIYYGGYSPTIVGAVNVTDNTVAYTLKSISMEGVYYLLLCLIP